MLFFMRRHRVRVFVLVLLSFPLSSLSFYNNLFNRSICLFIYPSPHSTTFLHAISLPLSLPCLSPFLNLPPSFSIPEPPSQLQYHTSLYALFILFSPIELNMSKVVLSKVVKLDAEIAAGGHVAWHVLLKSGALGWAGRVLCWSTRDKERWVDKKNREICAG